jgi:preprotein translocase subunit SecG
MPRHRPRRLLIRRTFSVGPRLKLGTDGVSKTMRRESFVFVFLFFLLLFGLAALLIPVAFETKVLFE